MLELWLVRHGETNWNLEAKVQGWTDVPLNENGILQAKRLSLQLEGIPFHAIICSDLERARKTAQILQSKTPAPLTIDPALRERCFGSAEGLFRSEVQKKFPDGAPDSETDEHIRERAMTFMKNVREERDNCRVLCVSHGGMIRAMLNIAGLPTAVQLSNTSVSRIQYRDHHWCILEYDWDLHSSSVDAKL